MRYLLFILTIAYCNIINASDLEVQPFKPEYCNLMRESWKYDECKDLEMQKNIGKYWQEMKTFWFKFQEAIKKDDKQALAAMMHYPLSVFYQPKPVSPFMDYKERGMLIDELVIKDKQDFIKNYDFIFNVKFKKQIIGAKYRELAVSMNVMRYIDVFSTVVFDKDCDPKQIPYEECNIIKVGYINNDAVLHEERVKD